MPYPPHLIHDDETVALDLNPHWWYFIEHIAVATGLVALLAFFLWLNSHSGILHAFATGIKWVLPVLLCAWAAWVVIRFLKWRNTFFVVTDRRVIFRSGFISKKGVEIPLDRITNIDFSQGPIERAIGAGDLDIQSAGRDGSSHFENVRHPDAVQQEIYLQMESREQNRSRRDAGDIARAINADASPAAPSAPQAAAPDAAEQLRKLADLRDEGVITPEEFETKKAEILGRM
ncbi:unannotated protein [freshwater metagenome]|uniref:Unannotated protein n=1 Tax=freshwater metagenome TaxID=449393 RepID=A0A6J6M3D2_9ZZZZ|nr:PH domain-containing protein [Actinomycetota bacterium]